MTIPSVEGCEVERGLLAAVLDVGVGGAAVAGADERADDVAVAVLGRAVQRRLLVRVLGKQRIIRRFNGNRFIFEDIVHMRTLGKLCSGGKSEGRDDVLCTFQGSIGLILKSTNSCEPPRGRVHFSLMRYRKVGCIRSFI